MKLTELDYTLPEELIAQKPAENREGSRMLVLNKDTGEFCDKHFCNIEKMIMPGDCLVLNNTKVLAARFFARRTSGAALEGLFLGVCEDNSWNVMLKNSRRLKIGERIILLDTKRNDFAAIKVAEKLSDGTFILDADNRDIEDVLEKIGFAPLPPYIKRPKGGDDPDLDKQRYQTVFAQNSGAVAAPTAGLHFSEKMLARLREKGVQIANITLHVGAGTFKPVTAERIEDHDIHSEFYSIDEVAAGIINKTKSNGGRIIAVGTTSVRTIETVAVDGMVAAQSGHTKLFITPGFSFQIVDAMITNFHLPKSTLLALIGAFAGLDNVLNAYKHAVEEKYRFFSYGDAMFIV